MRGKVTKHEQSATRGCLYPPCPLPMKWLKGWRATHTRGRPCQSLKKSNIFKNMRGVRHSIAVYRHENSQKRLVIRQPISNLSPQLDVRRVPGVSLFGIEHCSSTKHHLQQQRGKLSCPSLNIAMTSYRWLTVQTFSGNASSTVCTDESARPGRISGIRHLSYIIQADQRLVMHMSCRSFAADLSQQELPHSRWQLPRARPIVAEFAGKRRQGVSAFLA